MKPSTLCKLACLSWRAEAAPPRLWSALAVGVLVLGLGAAQAAPVSAPTETQTDTPINAENARVGVGTGGKVLDKSEQGGVSTGSRNLDLLLEMHHSDAAEGNKPVSSRGTSASAALPGGKSPQSQTGNRTPLPSPSQNALLGSDATGSQLRAEMLQAKRDWRAEDSLSSGSAGNDRRRPPTDAVPRYVNANGGDDEVLRSLPLTVIHFLRDNRTELLIGLALAVLVGAGLKAYSRRI